MDPYNKHVFFFINGIENKRKTYHAFICDKWKNAYNAAQAIAHMFGQSHEKYVRDMQNRKFVGKIETNKDTRETEDQIFNQDMMDFSIDFNTSITEKHELSKNWVRINKCL